MARRDSIDVCLILKTHWTTRCLLWVLLDCCIIKEKPVHSLRFKSWHRITNTHIVIIGVLQEERNHTCESYRFYVFFSALIIKSIIPTKVMNIRYILLQVKVKYLTKLTYFGMLMLWMGSSFIMYISSIFSHILQTLKLPNIFYSL